MKSSVSASVPVALLALASALCLLLGGQVATDSHAILPGTSPLVLALTGPDAPVTFMAIVMTLLAGGALWHITTHRVLVSPRIQLGITVLTFFGIVLVSVGISSFRGAAMVSAVHWLAAAVAFFGTIAVAGRGKRVGWILWAIFVAGVLLSARGVLEYGEMKSTDPSWRIFAGWVNPNALAAALLIAWSLGLSLVPQLPRLLAMAGGLGLVLIGIAMVLTQSKGGLLVMVVATVLHVVLSLVARVPAATALATPLVASAVVGLAAFGIASSSAPAAGSAGNSAITRVTSAGQTSEQSAGFRQLLWRGAGQLIRERPLGYGLGSYRFESARSGLTTQTVFAHNSYLQLGVEASAVTMLVLFAILAFAARDGFTGWRQGRDDPARALLRSGVVTAIVAIAVHAMIDSDLHYFGIGVIWFQLIAVALLLAPDAALPEIARPGMRQAIPTLLVLAMIFAAYVAHVDVLKAKARGVATTVGAAAAAGFAQDALNLAPYDGEAMYWLAQSIGSDRDRWDQAVALQPTTRVLRQAARAAGNDYARKVDLLQRALQRDPHNLPTLRLLLETHIAANATEPATGVAQRLVAVESTDYYRVRSLPELVPTETAIARNYLASQATDPAERVKLLAPALAIYREYLVRTVPQVRAVIKQMPNGNFAGESAATLAERMQMAVQVAEQLAADYDRLGDPGAATTARADAEAFRSAAK